MPSDQDTGPSAAAAWERHQVEAGRGGSVSLLALPDTSNPARLAEGKAPLLHIALDEPYLPTGPDGWPVFSLIIFLHRKPMPGEAWAPLVDGGQVSLDVTLSPPPLAREALARKMGAECLPIFARDSLFRLASPAIPAGAGTIPIVGEPSGQAERVLAEISVAGATPRAALSARLSAQETLALEDAFVTGMPEERLVLRGELGFRVAAPDPRTIRIVGVWARIFDAMAATLGGAKEITLDAVRLAANEMLRSRVLQAFDLDAEGEHAILPPLPEDTFRLFLAQASSVVLVRLASHLPTDDVGNRYELSDSRPMEAFTLDAVRRASAGSSIRRLVSEASIGQAIEQVRGAGMPLEAAVKFHVLQGVTGPSMGPSRPNGGAVAGPGPSAGPDGPTAPAPRLLRTARGSPSRAPAKGRPVMVGEKNGSARALGAVLQAGARAGTASASALMLSDTTITRPAGDVIRAGWVDDLHVPFRPVKPADGPESRPVVGNPGADPWPDRIIAGKNWYAPFYAPHMPDPGAATDKSPFLFSFERTGVTPSGAVGIRSTLRFTLGRELSASGKAAPPETMQRVNWTPTNGLSVTLQLPFVDESDGNPRTAPFPVTLQPQPDGSIRCTLELVNQWARLLYGALTLPGFQASPVRISVAYSFPAYIPAGRWRPAEWLMLSKEATIRVARRVEDRPLLAGQTHFDAIDGAIRHAGGEIRLAREAAWAATGASRLSAQGVQDTGAWRASEYASEKAPQAALAPRLGSAILASAAHTPLPRLGAAPPMIVLRPELRPVDIQKEVFIRADYYEQTIVREVSCDLMVPCSGFGAMYRDVTGGNDVAIGCQDALMLGRAEYRSHEEVPGLATARYRVFRSLQQVGRFLVLPAHYRVGRGDSAAGDRAFAPTIAMFSVLDPDNEARSRIAVEASLEPDIPPFARQELFQALRTLSQSPAIDYPTEVAKDLRFVWNLPSGLAIEPQALRVPNGLRATLGSDLMGAILLENLLCRDGVAASVTFDMPDGTTLPSVLEIGLSTLSGTWGTGPFAVSLDEGALRMTNRIERPVDLIEVIAVKAAGATERVPAEIKLAPGASHAVLLPPGTVEALPVYEVPGAAPATLEEVRGVIDRVTANIVFVDLINHENHGLAKIDLTARLRNVPGEQAVGLTGNPASGVATMILPLTTYLASRIMEFKVRKTFSDARTEDTPWMAWDLDKDGGIVSVTWELIAAHA